MFYTLCKQPAADIPISVSKTQVKFDVWKHFLPSSHSAKSVLIFLLILACYMITRVVKLIHHVCMCVWLKWGKVEKKKEMKEKMCFFRRIYSVVCMEWYWIENEMGKELEKRKCVKHESHVSICSLAFFLHIRLKERDKFSFFTHFPNNIPFLQGIFIKLNFSRDMLFRKSVNFFASMIARRNTKGCFSAYRFSFQLNTCFYPNKRKNKITAVPPLFTKLWTAALGVATKIRFWDKRKKEEKSGEERVHQTNTRKMCTDAVYWFFSPGNWRIPSGNCLSYFSPFKKCNGWAVSSEKITATHTHIHNTRQSILGVV